MVWMSAPIKMGGPFVVTSCCQKGAPSRTPRVGSCLTLGKELSEEKRADKARDFIGSRHQGGEQQGKVTQENCSAMWLPVSVLMVVGLVSELSLASYSDSGSFQMAHAWLNQDRFQ